MGYWQITNRESKTNRLGKQCSTYAKSERYKSPLLVHDPMSENGWSRDFLIEAIKQDYYHSHGALTSTFATTLPEIQAKQVKETLKDPYIFDMLTFTEEYDERDIELGLIKHIEVSE